MIAPDTDRLGNRRSLVPEAEGIVWSGIRATGGPAHA